MADNRPIVYVEGDTAVYRASSVGRPVRCLTAARQQFEALLNGPLRELLERGAGCGDRLRPVVMTAITTIFGLIPLALSGATVANVYIDSVAVAVIGGLTTSTIFTLLALPVWYTTVEDLGSLAARAFPRRAAEAKRLPVPRRGVLAETPESH